MFIVIVSHSSWLFRLWICIYSVAFESSFVIMTFSNDLKTIRFFCRMISKRLSLFVEWSSIDHVFSYRTFWSFFSLQRFLFRAQLVHAKTTLNCDRRYYKKRDDNRWWWSTNNVTRVVSFSERKCSHVLRSHNSIFLFSSSFYMFVVIIISYLSRWSYCDMLVSNLLWKFMHSWKCSVSYYQSFFINVFLERSTSSSHA
jgi:hypothetical protein